MKKVFVFDDNKSRQDHYIKTLNSDPYFNKVFEAFPFNFEELDELNKRRINERKNEDNIDFDLEIDQSDIFIVDFDLVEKDPNLDGEDLSYAVNCFSLCKFVIGLNKFGKKKFDFNLNRYPESYSNINIGNEHLVGTGLWGDGPDGFFPWSNFDINQFLGNRSRRMDQIEPEFNSSFVEVLKLNDLLPLMSQKAIEFIQGQRPVQDEDLGNEMNEGVMNLEFIKNLSFDDIAKNSLKGRDVIHNKKLKIKIAEFRLYKLFRDLILPGQDILVDIPHLILRYPSLLNGDLKNIEDWNKLISNSNEVLHNEQILPHSYDFSYWLPRPVYNWNELSEDLNIKEVKEPWLREEISFEFCEDASKFFPKDETIPFKANVESTFDIRFIKKFDNVNYQPYSRLRSW